MIPRNKRLLWITLFLMLAAVVVLGMKLGYPNHRLIAYVALALGWVPLIFSYRSNRRLFRVQKHLLKKKTRPFLPHAIMAVLLLLGFYVTWALFPAKKSPLAGVPPEQIREELSADLDAYLTLREAADDFVAKFRANGLLARELDSLSAEERSEIRGLWSEGVMAFLEYDLLKGKYRGFHQVDYVARPALHSDAFLLAYMAYVAQYEACLRVIELAGDDPFMGTLLNEEAGGVPRDTLFFMKQRLTNPSVLLRVNAAGAYYELVRDDVTIDAAIIADFKQRRRSYYKLLGARADLLVENPLAVLERAAFETMLPVQKNVATRMSYIRTAKRDYLITPEILAEHQPRLEPGDILIQRRNWHMTNIGIPGFWPHVALYVGTPEELESYFADLGVAPLDTIRALYPEAFAALNRSAEDGCPHRVIEAIRPGVVFQSLETSARCDYLGVIRPNLSKADKFKALLAAFSHHGKPYDLNFDFTTENALVCSELVYKSYRSAARLPLKPEVINGRRLLPPNRMAEQVVGEMGADGAFSFVLFLDAVEKSDSVVERDEEAFKESWRRPKWDVLQK